VWSKFLTVISFSLISTVFIFIISLVLGLIYSDYDEASIIFSDMDVLLAYFVKLLGFFSFCLFAGVLITRSAFALGFLILWQVFELFVRGMLRWKFLDKDTTNSVMDFFPLAAMANLIKEPLSRLGAVQSVANEIGEKIELNYQVHWYEILIVLCWTAILVYLCYALLKRRDL